MADRFEGVREQIEGGLQLTGTPSVAVAVAQDGEIVWEEGFGLADLESGIAASAHTPYSLASISKPVTAAGLMILAERGLIDIDRPVNDYLGEAKLNVRIGDERAATVRRVANHTAGLPLHAHFFYADEPYVKPEMDETIRRYGNCITAPGERYYYSNLGYGVLDYLIERLSGLSFGDFLADEVFAPLGMHHSAVGAPQGARAAAVRYGGDGVAYPDYDFDHPGASAVFASAHDLARFGMFQLDTMLDDQKPILTPETRRAMLEPTSGSGGEESRSQGGYGFGWSANPDQAGYATRGHTGGMGGVASVLSTIPDEGIVVAAVANSTSPIPFLATGEIYSALLPRFAEKWPETKQRMMGSLSGGEPGEPPVPGPGFQGTWRGEIDTHEGPRSVDLEFRQCGDVVVDVAAQGKALLNVQSAGVDAVFGVAHGHMGTADAARRHHQIAFDLKLRDDRVTGGAISVTSPTPAAQQEGGAPGRRNGNALAHWIELSRA